MRSKIRIATVYKRLPTAELSPTKMSTIRWLRISEALAERGYQVDMIMNGPPLAMASRTANLRAVTFADVDWQRYDVVKTHFHSGFEALWETGGGNHPFIISKLGSVVGNRDETDGVYFFERERERLYAIQERLCHAASYVTVLTEPSRRLWEELHGDRGNLLLVPTGVDRDLPKPGANPYARFSEPVAVYVGNIYGEMQGEMNALWQARLNGLGRRLRKKGIRLCFLGTGSVDRIDPREVTVLGTVHNDRVWDYQRNAHVGLVLAQGPVQHNESSKLYYYLRAGLPVVSEAPVPNNDLLATTGMGLVVEYGDERAMADMVESALEREWPRHDAVRHMIENHTWDRRVDAYDELIQRELGVEAA